MSKEEIEESCKDVLSQMKEDKADIETYIEDLLHGFVIKYGHCDIQITSQIVYNSDEFNTRKELISIDVDLNITI